MLDSTDMGTCSGIVEMISTIDHKLDIVNIRNCACSSVTYPSFAAEF